MAKLNALRDGAEPVQNRQGMRWSPTSVAMAFALLLSVALGLAWQTDLDRRAGWADRLSMQADAAALDAAQARAVVSEARASLRVAGAMAARAGAIDADAVALARTASVIGVAAIDAQGRVLAITDPAIQRQALQASVTAGRESTWTGLVAQDDAAPVAAVTERRTDVTWVAILTADALLNAQAGARTVAIADASGNLLAIRGGAAARSLQDAFGLARPPPPTSRHVFGADAQRQRLAVGFAPIAGQLVAYSAVPADAPIWGSILTIIGAGLTLAAPALTGLLALYGANRRVRMRAEDAEQQLDRVRQHFRLAVDGARAGVWTLRRGQDTIEMSPRLQRLVSAPSLRMPVSRFAALAVEEDRADLHAAFIQAVESGTLEVSFRVMAGETLHWIEMRAVAVEEADGEGPILVGTALDITPRREAELRTVAVERRMKEAIESFSGTFALFDQRKRLIAWNRAFARAFALPPETLRRGISYDAISTAAAGAIRSERSNPADPQSREVELATGTWLQLVERRTLEGGSIIVGLDISALKRQEEELVANERKMRKAFEELERSEGREKELKKRYESEKERAEEASKAKTNFLANMSHELRTPLNAINGFSEVIAREIFGPLGNPKYKEYAGDIQASGQLLLDMIGDILDMARIEAGKFNLAPRPFDPMLAIDQAVRLMRRRAQDKQLALTVDTEAVPEIVADHRAVKQMLLNLLSNSLKFTETGEVRVRARPGADGWLFLQVIDTGPGIPEEALTRIARPFEQVDAEYTRAHAGTGLGLALTKAFAELHGGTFAIESVVGSGTTVTIGLPPHPPGFEPTSLTQAA